MIAKTLYVQITRTDQSINRYIGLLVWLKFTKKILKCIVQQQSYLKHMTLGSIDRLKYEVFNHTSVMCVLYCIVMHNAFSWIWLLDF